MILTELFDALQAFPVDDYTENKIEIDLKQHMKNVEDAAVELAKNGYIVTDKIHAIIEMDLKLYPQKYNTADIMDLPDNATAMRLIKGDPKSNYKFINGESTLLQDDILYCGEEKLLFKDLKLIGDYFYQDKYYDDYEVAYIYQYFQNKKMYEVYAEVDGYNNLYFLETSPISYPELMKKIDYEGFDLYTDLKFERRKYIISNII